MIMSPKHVVTLKEISQQNIEVIREGAWVKFRDKEMFTSQESPSLQLRFLIEDKGIRVQTTTYGGQRNMFMIHHADIERLRVLLQQAYPDFEKYLMTVINDTTCKQPKEKIPTWWE